MTVKEIPAKLNDIKKKIEERKTKKAQLEGQKAQLLQNLGESFGLSSLEEAKAKADEIDKTLNDKEAQLKDMIEDLEELAKEL